jgi:hypothetical protein
MINIFILFLQGFKSIYDTASVVTESATSSVLGMINLALMAIIGFLFVASYYKLNNSNKNLDTTVKETNKILGEISQNLSAQNIMNQNNIKEHNDMRYDIEDNHQRVNKAEKKIIKIETIEENCPSNPFKNGIKD